MSGFLPVVTAINNWFSKRRGLATGISSAGVNIGGILVAAVALSISHFGWRTAAVIIAVIICSLGFPMAAMMRHKPQDYGYQPDGIESQPTPKNQVDGHDDNFLEENEPDFTAIQALRTPAFWFIAAAHGFSLFIVGSISIHQIPLLVDVGISYEQSASILAFMTFMAMLGRIGGGYLGDVFGRKTILVICFFMMSAGVIILAMAQNVLQALIYAVIYGIGYGARAPILIALRGEFFGPRNFATIMGLSQPIMVIGSFFGPIAAGFAYDIQGSYRMIFSIIAAINLVGALLVFFIEKPKPPTAMATKTPPV